MLCVHVLEVVCCCINAENRRQFRYKKEERVVVPKSYRHLTYEERCQIEAE